MNIKATVLILYVVKEHIDLWHLSLFVKQQKNSNSLRDTVAGVPFEY